ncbi:MAG TPA: bifunctional hydroxymethylpyrimidine kinase/phosphomethylpyrimidine kinase [Acetobacteraceae bacterium]|jgi:hydroxymethylpyrimidine/phosphomethylpyrimidine kinase|nr:bifunctional hydroxymethylpyrimidine kinase/phosphomethylpyrimidine kinase [Acetobacteraceae bacterium]
MAEVIPPEIIPNVLTIAGSDPSGGAGIQADLKTFSALGVYGASVITALTAQNTQGVRGFTVVEPDFVAAQIDSVFEDLRIDAVKIGMVATAAVAMAIAGRLRHYKPRNVVLDPVMVAKSGDRLLQDDAIAAISGQLVPLATVITPNLPEAAVLCGEAAPATLADMHRTVRALHGLGARAVLLKGGALDSADSPDLLFDGSNMIELPARRIATRNTHGTGCTLSAALAALLPRYELPEAARRAKAYLTAALAASDRLSVGSGRGPVHHFYALWTGGRTP